MHEQGFVIHGSCETMQRLENGEFPFESKSSNCMQMAILHTEDLSQVQLFYEDYISRYNIKEQLTYRGCIPIIDVV